MKRSKRLVIAVLIILISGIYFYKTQIMNIEKNSENKFLSAINNALLSSNEEEISVTGETEDTEQTTPTISTENWDLTKVNIVYDTEGVPVPVPKGYVASGSDGEHTVNTGFVIYEGEGEVTTENAWDESVSRNQWVWVPVYDSSRIYSVDSNGRKKGKLYENTSTGRYEMYRTDYYEPGISTKYDDEKYFSRYNSIEMTRNNLYKELQLEYDLTIESIEKYGGFYIGRYETGNLSSKVPVVKRMNTLISDQNWYTMYIRMKYLGVNNNVKANIIWGCLWDETLQWLVDTGCKTYEQVGFNSKSWGNYYDATFEYTNTRGDISTKAKQSPTKIPTGSTEYTNANNIYDMAGNVSDRTLEVSKSYGRTDRGSEYSAGNNRASYRSASYPYDTYPRIGYRAYFYIK